MTLVTRSSEPPTPPSILAVNGNPDILEGFADLLTSKGYKVESVLYGEACFACIQHRTFRALILHDRLPDINGLFLLAAIRIMQPELPVIVTTVSRPSPSALLQYAFAVLVLPYRREELLDLLQRAVFSTTTTI
jgi:DNA-binding NtrC family response regulator